MNAEEHSPLLAKFFAVLPLVKELVRGDITMAVCDREKYIFSLINPKIDTGVQAVGATAAKLDQVAESLQPKN